MLKLLKVELRCLFRQKSTYICLLIVIAIVALPVLLYISDETIYLQSTGLNLFHSSFSGSLIDILLPILISILVCRDFSSDAVRLIVGRGYSRTKIFFSKWITTLIVILLFALTAWVTIYISLAAMLHFNMQFTPHLFMILLTQLLVAAAISSVAFSVAFIARKTSAAITLGILCPTLGTILTSVIESVLKIENGKISRFWIWSCFAQLTGDTISNDTLYFSMLLSVIWMAVFLTAGLIHFKRTDV